MHNQNLGLEVKNIDDLRYKYNLLSWWMLMCCVVVVDCR